MDAETRHAAQSPPPHLRKRRLSSPMLRLLTGATIGLLAGLLAFALRNTPVIKDLDHFTYDQRFQTRIRIRGKRPTRAKVVIIALDNASLYDPTTIDQSPLAEWGAHFAEVVRLLRTMDAAAIGFDLTQDAHGGVWDSAGRPLIPDPNRAWAKEILKARGKVVLPAHLSKDLEGRQHVRSGIDLLNTAASAAAADSGLPALGMINSYADDDDVVRSQAPLYLNPNPGEPSALPTLSLLLAQRVDPDVPQSEFLINYLGPAHTVDHISMRDLLDPQARRALGVENRIRDAIAIVARTDDESNDFVDTPLGRMEGSEVHANSVATLLDRAPIHNLYRILFPVTLIAGIVTGLIAIWAPPARSAGIVLLLALLWAGFVWWEFVMRSASLPVIQPLFAAIIAFPVDLIWRQRVSDREVNLLGKCVGPAVRGELRRDPASMDAEGQEYDLTVMFTDIRAFTAWSQGKSAIEVVRLINKVGLLITRVVWEQRGTLDKFLGDGMMAFFGAPREGPDRDHARRAVRCALNIQAALAKSPAIAQQFPGIRIGVGLHTGPAVVGFLKAEQKHEFTAIGDTVNLASRLQDATKYFAATLVMSVQTFEAAKAAEPTIDEWILAQGFTIEGPVEYAPHNHEPIRVYAVRAEEPAGALAGRKAGASAA